MLVLRDRDLCHVQPHPIWLGPTAGYRSWPVASNLHSGHLSEGLCHGQGSLLLALSFPSIPQWLGIQQKRTRVPLSLNNHRRFMANKGVFSVFTLDCLQADHWVRVDYYIMANWVHMSVIVQCQGDGCSLSSKDGAVVRQPLDKWRQVVSPFWKWRLMTAAAPTLSFILEPSV